MLCRLRSISQQQAQQREQERYKHKLMSVMMERYGVDVFGTLPELREVCHRCCCITCYVLCIMCHVSAACIMHLIMYHVSYVMYHALNHT